MQIVREPITKEELKKMAEKGFGDMVKAVVDIQQGIMALDGEFHSEEEALLMQQAGSSREHTWGINLYPAKEENGFIEFDSMINLKPACGNRSRNVERSEIQEKIRSIVKKLII